MITKAEREQLRELARFTGGREMYICEQKLLEVLDSLDEMERERDAYVIAADRGLKDFRLAIQMRDRHMGEHARLILENAALVKERDEWKAKYSVITQSFAEAHKTAVAAVTALHRIAKEKCHACETESQVCDAAEIARAVLSPGPQPNLPTEDRIALPYSWIDRIQTIPDRHQEGWIDLEIGIRSRGKADDPELHRLNAACKAGGNPCIALVIGSPIKFPGSQPESPTDAQTPSVRK